MKRRSFLFSTLIVSIILIAGISAPAFATVEEGDQSQLTDEEIANAISSGDIPAYGMADAQGEVATDDSDSTSTGPLSTYETDSLDVQADSSYLLRTIAGMDRYATNRLEVQSSFTSSAYAIIASGEKYTDALTVSGLAGALQCPILFSSQASIPADTLSLMNTLGVSKVIIVGDTSSISSDVESLLISRYGSSSVTRLAGADRFGTQQAIFNYGVEKDLWSDTAFVTNGYAFADALSISPVAYKLKAPIFFVGSDSELTDATAQELLDETTVKHAVILGGTGSVSSVTDGFLDMVTLKNGGDEYSTRLGGTDRYDTSVLIANWAIDQGYLSWNGAALATGTAPYDALGASAMQARNGSVLLLMDTSNLTAMYKLIDARPSYITVLGGTDKIDAPTRTITALELGYPLSKVQGFILFLDAGHGWNNTNNGTYDTGAIGSGYIEAQLNAELANKVATILRSTYGMNVYVNDDGGWYKLRQTDAYDRGCGAIVSIHFNATDGATASGSLSLIHNYRAQMTSDILQGRVHPYLIQGVGLKDRGMLTQEVAILGGKLPATLLEVCFIDNESDMAVYQSRKDYVATEIAAGIAS